MGRIEGDYVQPISDTSGNILVFIIDKFKLELAGHSLPVDYGPSDKTFRLVTVTVIRKDIASRTVVISKKPITAFKTIGLGIVEQYRIKPALVPLVGNIT